jgi:septum formation protein
MLHETIKDYHLILATQSPRRHQLMKGAGFNFDVIVPEGIEEIYPVNMPVEDIPVYLAELKSSYFINKLKNNDIVITADTVVILNNELLGKPSGKDEAVSMLKKLSATSHKVITGVCFYSVVSKIAFSAESIVHFRTLTDEEISFYVETYKPYDKAGAYGAQEWIGYVGIDWIEGSYFNVMGLPVQKVYKELEKFIETLKQ